MDDIAYLSTPNSWRVEDVCRVVSVHSKESNCHILTLAFSQVPREWLKEEVL